MADSGRQLTLSERLRRAVILARLRADNRDGHTLPVYQPRHQNGSSR